MDIVVEFWNVTLVVLLGFCGVVGLLAIVNPKMFEVVCSYGNRAVIQSLPSRDDRKWIDLDSFAIAHGRLFGFLVIATVAYLWVVSNHGPEVYSKSFIIIISGVGLAMFIVVMRQILRLSREVESHRAEALTDGLTGLQNRRAFDSELSRRLAQRQHRGIPLSLVILDVDKFKTFNDDFGHALGDEVLKRVSDVLTMYVQEGDVVARLGGDEFAVVLSDSGLDEASRIAERFRSAICEIRVRHDDLEHRVTVSVGLAEAQLDDDPNSLLRRSDSALYTAKEAGRNCSFRQAGPEPALAIRSSNEDGGSSTD